MTRLCVLLVGMLAGSLCCAEAAADAVDTSMSDGTAAGTSCLVTDFSGGFDYSYLSFEKSAAVADGVARIVAENGKGGSGIIQRWDFGQFGAYSPAIRAKAGLKNQAKQVKLSFNASGGKRLFAYDIETLGQDAFVLLLPEHGLALSPAVANEPNQAFDPAEIEGLQIQGDWSSGAVDVLIDKIELVAPTAEMKAQRAAYREELQRKREREARAAQRRREETAKLLAGAPHPADGPDVRHVGMVAADTISLIIEAGEIVLRRQTPYVPKTGDKIRLGKKGESKKVLCWKEGEVVEAAKGTYLLRDTDGSGRLEEMGPLVEDRSLLAPGPAYEGTAMTVATIDQPRAYRIVSAGDLHFRTPAHPAAVFVKSKPTGQADGKTSVRYHVYLRLSEPLEQGADYTIEMVGVNTRQKQVKFRNEPRQVRSEAVHVTQIGYRPSDPFKRAYLSLWMGTGGAAAYEVDRFELVDATTGRTAHTGQVVPGFAADRKESIRGKKNNTQTNVYYLDFHEFDRPGTYRVFVPGVGVSYPFDVAEDVWAKAFSTSMHGFLSHRSGIGLGAPFTEYERPRPMHPADGFGVFELDVTYWTGEADAVNRSLRRLLGSEPEASRLTEYPGAWGGYMDAGDWDRRSQHLIATWVHLELLDCFGAYFERCKLALPPNEANDGLPDILNEALWNLDFYRRLQRGHGGVGGGVESTSHPVPGEASWQESLLVGTFAPDPETSLRYAACAATAARLLEQYDKALAATYASSAVRAWNWANANEDGAIRSESTRTNSRGGKSPDKLRESVRDMRALAAAALYRLTGRAEYHEAFKQCSLLVLGDVDPGKQLHSIFAYARLSDRLADLRLQQKAIDWFEDAAEDSMEFAGGNAFGITCRVPMLPLIGYVGYYSVPETSLGAILPRAHYLTGKQEYLQGALAAAHFSAGANPMNMTFTTGLGHRCPKHPLHVDSQHAGIAAPTGITVYGINDPAMSGGHLDWAHTWYLRNSMIPNSRSWPAAEFYVDLGNWPPVNEYTVHQTFAPISFYWGYLAARPGGK